MTTTVTIKAEEESTYIIQVSFKDEDGNAVVPDTIYWKLTDSDGNVINSRNAISVVPAFIVDITLSGDDLIVITGKGSNKKRILTVWGIYDSDLGINLPYKDACKFFLKDLTAVS